MHFLTSLHIINFIVERGCWQGDYYYYPALNTNNSLFAIKLSIMNCNVECTARKGLLGIFCLILIFSWYY
jgi:hypothetical protein